MVLAGHVNARSRAAVFLHTTQPNIWNTILKGAEILKDVDDMMSKRHYERLRLLSGSVGVVSNPVMGIRSNRIAETSSGDLSAPRPAPKKLKERGNQRAL
jgi:hypothetical protein